MSYGHAAPLCKPSLHSKAAVKVSTAARPLAAIVLSRHLCAHSWKIAMELDSDTRSDSVQDGRFGECNRARADLLEYQRS